VKRIAPGLQAIRAPLILAALALTGCYLSAPADPSTVPQGERLRVVLTEQGMERLRSMAPQVEREVSGRLMRLTADSMTIATEIGTSTALGPALGGIRQPLTFARAEITEVTVPRLGRGRTFLLVGVAVAGAAYLATELLDLGGAGGGLPPPGNPGSPFRIPF